MTTYIHPGKAPTNQEAIDYANTLMAKYYEPVDVTTAIASPYDEPEAFAVTVTYASGLTVDVWWECYSDRNEGKPYLYGEY